MNIKIITSTNDIEKYRNFWPSISKHWENYYNIKPVLGFITNRKEDDKIIERMRGYGEIKIFNEIEGVPSPNQAKVTRMWLASEYGDELCMIVDIDMYLLNKNLIDNCLKRLTDENIIAVGANAYFNSPSAGKFPMCYTIGYGKSFKKIVNPENLDYYDLLDTWCETVIDGKENIKLPPMNFSDESLLRVLIKKTNNEANITHIHRDDFVGMRAMKRLSRENFNIDLEKLKNGYYIDCAPERPLIMNNMTPVFDYLGIEKNDRTL